MKETETDKIPSKETLREVKKVISGDPTTIPGDLTLHWVDLDSEDRYLKDNKN
jgi:hypothetical protein